MLRSSLALRAELMLRRGNALHDELEVYSGQAIDSTFGVKKKFIEKSCLCPRLVIDRFGPGPDGKSFSVWLNGGGDGFKIWQHQWHDDKNHGGYLYNNHYRYWYPAILPG